jgi:Fe-S-cluster containining protein
MKKKEFWSEGLRFQCQGSAKCCISRGGYGFVYLTKADRKAMAKHFKMSLRQFTEEHCEKQDGIFKLKESENDDCRFLDGKQCGVYEARPTQCRTWPFWPEVMTPRKWNKDVASFCPGVGKGRLWTAKEIEEQLKEQVASEKQYGS